MSHDSPRDPRNARGLAFGKIMHEGCEALLAVAEARDDLADAQEATVEFNVHTERAGAAPVVTASAAVERALARHARAMVAETRERARILTEFNAADAHDIFRAAERYVAQDARGRTMLEAL